MTISSNNLLIYSIKNTYAMHIEENVVKKYLQKLIVKSNNGDQFSAAKQKLLSTLVNTTQQN